MERVVFRELKEPAEVVTMLRVRHAVYFEQNRYGATKPLGIDLTAHDQHARLFGVWRGDELVGGVRVVCRHDQPLAPVIRAMRAVVDQGVAEQCSRALPSEEAFDLASVLGARRELIDAEVGRLFVCRERAEPGVVRKMMVATLAVLHLLRARLYLYSCAVALASRYAAVAKPRWVFEAEQGGGIRADNFVFPSQSRAGVAGIDDSPYFVQALELAAELAETGAITFTRSQPALFGPSDRAQAE
ncbi:MAG: GNAT family N-acyltransferase [Polyangiales bacterium]